MHFSHACSSQSFCSNIYHFGSQEICCIPIQAAASMTSPLLSAGIQQDLLWVLQKKTFQIQRSHDTYTLVWIHLPLKLLFLSPCSIIFQQVRIYCTYVLEFGVLEFIVAAAGPRVCRGTMALALMAGAGSGAASSSTAKPSSASKAGNPGGGRPKSVHICPRLSDEIWYSRMAPFSASASFVSWKAFGVMIYNQSTEQPHVLRDVPKLGTVDLNCGTGSHQVFSQVYSFAHRTAPEVKKAPQKMDSKKASCSMGLGP